jgi:SNF2 family DNA or RNA helicase
MEKHHVFLLRISMELRDIRSDLVICPASLKHQWAREIRRFTSLPVTVVEGNLKARREQYRQASFFKAINYEIVRRERRRQGPES